MTTTAFYDHDGAEHTYVSGEDDDAPHAGDVLRQVGAAASPIGTYPTATHVEIKAAVSMRDAGESRGVIVINNPTGPCPGNLGCTAALPRVLPSGATLVVWWRSSLQSWRTVGDAAHQDVALSHDSWNEHQTRLPAESFITITQLRAAVLDWAFGNDVPPRAVSWAEVSGVDWF
jgi:hypothetical protein